ncbi:MAG: SUMF1/EgtB/PvdO family nonheme iron enzyme [Candidatus Hydrogenedentes bacterium]|nr:SUMF1/EgtB/PvdO family nonheme iron enzyme [Candidatus Hydrogenedentota bacterium]
MTYSDVRQSMLDDVVPLRLERAEPLVDPLLGTRLGHYQIEFVLGKGAYGAVYKARDVTLGRYVAIKFLHQFLDKSHEAMFLEEAKAVAALGKHPSIVTIFEFSEYQGRKYFVLEFVGSHAGMLLRVHPKGLPIEMALRIGKESAEGLAYAHKRYIIHRDIKPANILLEIEGGSAKLADFGVARLFDPTSNEQGGAPGGTPAYMAPEVIGGYAGDTRTDVFSHGVTLYELLCGSLPFRGDTAEAIMSEISANRHVPLRERRELPAAVTAIVEKAMAHHPEDRYSGAAELAEALAKCLIPAAGTVVASPAAPDLVSLDDMKLVKLRAYQLAQDAKRNGGDKLAHGPLNEGVEAFRNGEAYEQLKQYGAARDAFNNASAKFKEAVERSKALMDKMLALKATREKMESIRAKAEAAHAHRLAPEAFATASMEEKRARETAALGKATQSYHHAATLYVEALKQALQHGEAALVAPRERVAELRKLIDVQGVAPFARDEIAQANLCIDRARRSLPDFTAAKQHYLAAAAMLEKAIPAGMERKRQDEEKQAREPITVAGIELVWIPPGTFYMGSDDGSVEEEPRHPVTISRGLWVGKYPVTQSQWEAIMGGNPSVFKGDPNLPVENVSWHDCQEFVRKLTAQGAGRFRLLSEAEWEYACRAGEPGDWCFGSDPGLLNEYAWNHEIANGRTHPVGEKKPNGWGLHDMHGNVCEWCEDHHHQDYNGAPVGGAAWIDDGIEERITRGGSWCIITPECRSAYRGWYARPDTTSDFMGLRVCKSD